MIQHAAGVMPEFDERREIWRLLQKATPPQRIKWLQWCCEQVSRPCVKTTVQQSSGTATEVWWDWCSLAFGSILSVTASGEKLVEIVRGRDS